MMSPKQHFTPTPEQRKAADPAHSVWVAASAGSGKTQVLIDRVIRLMLNGAAPQSILCLTFTKAAAAEMSTRLFDRLSQWIAIDDQALDESLQRLGVPDPAEKRVAARRLFAKALETPGGLKIQTIHAFCERLLQLFPVEAALAPGFRVMDEAEAKALRQRAFVETLTDQDPHLQAAWEFLESSGVASMATLEATTSPILQGNGGLREQLSDTTTFLAIAQKLATSLVLAPGQSKAGVEAELCAIAVQKYEKAALMLAPLAALKDHPTGQLLAKAASNPTADALFNIFLIKTGSPRVKLLLSETTKALPKLADWLNEERARIAEAFDKLSRAQIYENSLAVYAACAGVLARINQLKRAQGLYDFDDLISSAAKLLHSTEAAQWVLYKLDAGLNHILVDEAQDTSPAQWKIIQALADEFFSGEGRGLTTPRTVFAVGDRKQSIYSFQGADTQAFEAARSRFSSRLRDVQKPLQEVGLTVSYRSTPEVLLAVDTVFAKGRLPRQGFGLNADQETDHQASRQKAIGVFELWPMVTKGEEADPDYWQSPVDLPPQDHPRRLLARRIAQTIAGWIGKRQIVALGRSVEAGDILILLQRRNMLFSALIAEMRRLGIAVAGADRLKLHDSLIIHDLLALGQVMRMPDDDHALACVLKSPLLPQPLSEAALFTLSYGRAAESLWSRLQASD